MEDNFDIFNLSIEDFKTPEKPKSGSDNIYKTDPKLSKDSIYRAIVRFVPNPKNIKESSIRKFSYWLEDATGAGFYADCPSSNPGEKSIIQDTFWKLYKSESAFEKKQAERMKRKEYYYSYVLVVKDPQRPELENTIQTLRYPKAVKKMIDAQTSPSAEDIEMGVEPTNIFDLLAGKDFSLKVTLKGGYWNYDECKFGANCTPATVNGAKMEANAESRKMINALYKDLPPLENHKFKPWTEELQKRVYAYLAELTGKNPGAGYAAVTGSQKSEAKTESPKNKEENHVSESTSNPSKGGDGEIEEWLKEFDIK